MFAPPLHYKCLECPAGVVGSKFIMLLTLLLFSFQSSPNANAKTFAWVSERPLVLGLFISPNASIIKLIFFLFATFNLLAKVALSVVRGESKKKIFIVI